MLEKRLCWYSWGCRFLLNLQNITVCGTYVLLCSIGVVLRVGFKPVDLMHQQHTRHLPYMENCYCTFVHLCSTDLMKEIAPVEGN